MIFKGAQIIHDSGAYLGDRSDMIRAVALSTRLSMREKLLIKRYHRKTLLEVFELCRVPEGVRRALFGHAGIFAETAESLSVGIYASATGYYHSGASYPKRGFDVLIEGLAQVIEKNGGKVHHNKRICSLETENNRVLEARCEDGSRFRAEFFIRCLSPRLTSRLLSGKPEMPFSYAVSNSLTGCFLGVHDYPEIGRIAKKNLWWQAYPAEVGLLLLLI